ncbi:hypothetical protein VIGAN_09121800 [Vigna angularis var. angularis]|uniref:Uncharacterized protein n=1 Tax=Vigna angularis var. angularis TaxID=157739 RepID=A0A0S3SXU2_PHAAN|nr:hypothetical protein VIGAN_09121800 [Vigna angularis var. angularis]
MLCTSSSTHGSTIPAFESLLLRADREGGYVCCHQRAFSFPFIHGFSSFFQWLDTLFMDASPSSRAVTPLQLLDGLLQVVAGP